ncbi:MAG: hypothetical protein AB9866_27085 [Syntrophobacteraceae bacterium]
MRLDGARHRDREKSDSYQKSSPLVGIRTSRNKITAYAKVENDQYSPASQGKGSYGLYLKSGGSYTVSKNLFIFGEVNYRPNGERYGGQLGIDWQLPHGSSAAGFRPGTNRQSRSRRLHK